MGSQVSLEGGPLPNVELQFPWILERSKNNARRVKLYVQIKMSEINFLNIEPMNFERGEKKSILIEAVAQFWSLGVQKGF